MAGDWATPQNQLRVARAAEDLGYHSLWVFQRLFYALKPKNDYPPLPGQPWPKSFERVLDPIVSLTWVAAVTQRVRLGASVLIMPYYTPVLLAKQLATLDLVSNGRLDVGVGLGWSEDEYDAVERSVSPARQARATSSSMSEGDLDQGRSRVRGRVLPRAAREDRAQARAEAAPADHRRRVRPVVVKRAVTLGDGFNGGNVPARSRDPGGPRAARGGRQGRQGSRRLHVVSRGSYVVYDAPQGKDRRPLWGRSTRSATTSSATRTPG
jgi:hypothetical protein